MPRADTHRLSQPMFQEPIFSEGTVTPDPTGFVEDHPSDAKLYREVEKLLKTKVVGFPKSRIAPDALYSLADAYGARGDAVTKAITEAGRIVFHAVGDTGATTGGSQYQDELSVADQMTMDCNITEVANRPSFLLHLGDVVYDFGESQYYYDQFYAPYRDYPAPIFALAGNHDSFVVPGTPEGETPLDIFMRNFCAEHPAVTREAASLHRTAMTQPGVYYALDVPFARILCLFSNALEDPGLISGEDGRWPGVPDLQLDFLEAQLTRIKTEAYAGAVLLAVHHPPFSYAAPPRRGGETGVHSGSISMLRQIDEICERVGVYPHAVLSGHAHLYERYTRTITFGGEERDVPFIICGSGGHHINTIVRAKRGHMPEEPHFGVDVSYLDRKPAIPSKGLILEKYNDTQYGYLRISVDAEQLAIGYHLVGDVSIAQSRYDKVTVDIAKREMVAN